MNIHETEEKKIYAIHCIDLNILKKEKKLMECVMS